MSHPPQADGDVPSAADEAGRIDCRPRERNGQGMTKRRMPLVFLVFIIGIIVSIALRTAQLVYAVDPFTGFYRSGSPLVPTLNAVLILFTLLLLTPLLFKNLSKETAVFEKSKITSVFAVIVGIMLCLDATGKFFTVLSSQSDAGNMLVALTAFLSAIFFFVFANFKFKGQKADFALISLLPVLWGILNLTVSFMHYTTIANISSDLLDVLTMVFILIFLYYHARVIGKVANGREMNGLFAFGLSSVLFELLYTIPKYAALPFKRGSAPVLHDFLYIALALYTISFLVETYFNKEISHGDDNIVTADSGKPTEE